MRRLGADGDTGRARPPAYEPERHAAGIVHLGCGAFHRAHQAPFTDDALAAAGGDWRIVAASLRGDAVADALNPQQGRYTLLVREPDTTRGRVVASVARVIAHRREPEALPRALADPAARVVSLTVTEKGYARAAGGRGVDAEDRLVARDIAALRARGADGASSPVVPASVAGLLVDALARRRAAGEAPFTVLCCDNLADNGTALRSVVLDFAERVDPDLARWIARETPFPSTMVDRITPAPTERTREDAAALTGREDRAAVETEPFSQWVIEDRFVSGRPAWEAGGALFVDAVAPYERMKLRMLNGAHTLIASLAVVLGIETVAEAVADADIRAAVERHFAAAAATLDPVPEVDLDDYARALMTRFANPAIRHRALQIAADGTEKLPPRLLEPAIVALERGQDATAFAFAVAAWAHYARGRGEDGSRHEVVDPRAAAIARAVAAAEEGGALVDALDAELGLFDAAPLAGPWRRAVAARLDAMRRDGPRAALAAYRAA